MLVTWSREDDEVMGLANPNDPGGSNNCGIETNYIRELGGKSPFRDMYPSLSLMTIGIR